MTKTLKHFSLLFVFIFSMVSAEIKEDQYRLYVTMVDPEFHCFALSNNMICEIPKRHWEKEALPEVGTEVYFYSDIRLITNSEDEYDEFAMGYSQDPSKKLFNVRITPESKHYGLSFVTSACIITAPAGWIRSEQYRDVVQLSDGSQWVKVDDGKTVFGPESRLLVSKQKDGGFSIIDLDVITHGCKCRAEKRGRALTWHQYERVKPYNPETTN